MKKIILLLSILFCTTVFAHSIEWYVGDTLLSTTTCESGDNITPPTAPAKYGYHFKKWAEYIPIEYLESTGTQWIDTGVVPKGASTKVVITTLATLNDQDNGKPIFGSRNYYGIDAFVMSFFNSKDVSNLRVQYGNSLTYNLAASSSLLNKKIIIELDKNVFTAKYYTGAIIGTYSEPIQYFTPIGSAYLFAWNLLNGSNENLNNGIQIYNAKIYDNNTLVRDFIPVLDHNGTPCMYDKVEGKFYYNQGTGNFIAGPALQ